jgi:collagen beta-1,O-galactosyltransferase
MSNKNIYLYYFRDKLSLNEIFMINLERRKERRQKMELSFKVIGLDVQYFPAVDGKKLNDEVLKEMNVKLLPEYEDPYHKRPMTMGEVGCFLSHYSIWEKMVQYNLEEVLILEDDIKFEPFFKDRALYVINEARQLGGWDLIYFGRKRLQESNEELIKGSEDLVKVGYSYWTLGYLISLRGAKKLTGARPLEKLVPVDEFLPIMFDAHPNDTWREKFPNRNLVAWSTAPLLLFPTHYTGEDGYISDTENSAQIELKDDLIAKFDKNDNIQQKQFLKNSIKHTRSEL